MAAYEIYDPPSSDVTKLIELARSMLEAGQRDEVRQIVDALPALELHDPALQRRIRHLRADLVDALDPERTQTRSGSAVVKEARRSAR